MVCTNSSNRDGMRTTARNLMKGTRKRSAKAACDERSSSAVSPSSGSQRTCPWSPLHGLAWACLCLSHAPTPDGHCPRSQERKACRRPSATVCAPHHTPPPAQPPPLASSVARSKGVRTAVRFVHAHSFPSSTPANTHAEKSLRLREATRARTARYSMLLRTQPRLLRATTCERPHATPAIASVVASPGSTHSRRLRSAKTICIRRHYSKCVCFAKVAGAGRTDSFSWWLVAGLSGVAAPGSPVPTQASSSAPAAFGQLPSLSHCSMLALRLPRFPCAEIAPVPSRKKDDHFLVPHLRACQTCVRTLARATLFATCCS